MTGEMFAMIAPEDARAIVRMVTGSRSGKPDLVTVINSIS
jgi:hypothetical protein